MGFRMNCHTTPKNEVRHGEANHPKQVASPPPPPTGAVGGGGARQLSPEVVRQTRLGFDLVPMPGFFRVGGYGGRGYLFALCGLWFGWIV